LKDIKRIPKGVSLIEIMIVVTIFSILAIMSTRGVLLTLRGSRKSDSASRVRENLDYSLSVIERQLRNADSVSCISSTRVNFVDKAGTSGYFSCENVGVNGHIASSSARLTNVKIAINSCQIVCEDALAGIPPSISIQISANDITTTGIETSDSTVSTKIFLRTY